MVNKWNTLSEASERTSDSRNWARLSSSSSETVIVSRKPWEGWERDAWNCRNEIKRKQDNRGVAGSQRERLRWPEFEAVVESQRNGKRGRDWWWLDAKQNRRLDGFRIDPTRFLGHMGFRLILATLFSGPLLLDIQEIQTKD